MLKGCSREKKWIVRYPPYWFQRGRIGGEAGNDMPVDMRKSVSEQFVVHLLCLVDRGRDIGHSADLFDELQTFGRCEVE